MDEKSHKSYPIVVLTLRGDEERRENLVHKLKEEGLDFEVFFGVDGRNGLPEDMERLIDRPGTVNRIWRRMSDGEYACALSHQAIYRMIVDRNLPGCVVLEDDALLQPGFAEFVREKQYLKHDMVLLDHDKGMRMPWGPGRLSGSVVTYRIAAPPWNTTGYSVSRRAAERILRRSHPIRSTADWPCNIARLDCHVTLPRLVTGPPGGTAHSHLALERSAELTRPRNARLRGLFSVDKWFSRIAGRIGKPLDR